MKFLVFLFYLVILYYYLMNERFISTMLDIEKNEENDSDDDDVDIVDY